MRSALMNARLVTSLVAAGLLVSSDSVLARGGHGSGSRSSVSHSHSTVHSSSKASPALTPKEHRSRASGVQRDSEGRIERSSAAKETFMRQSGHPNGWPGHVVDHIVPLKRGGKDEPGNMQWQTIAAGKAKDKIE